MCSTGRYKGANVSKDKRWRIYRRDNFTCVLCTQELPPCGLSLDHVIPKSQGGTLAYTNLITCCVRCNCRRGAGPIPKHAKRRVRNALRRMVKFEQK